MDKTMRSIKATVVFLLMLAGSTVNAEVRNFSLSANSVYLPGEEIVLNFYSYSYGEKDNSYGPFKVRFTVYEITDPEKFYSSQASSYVTDLISKDTVSLLGSVKKTESFTRTFTPKKEYGYYAISENVNLKVRDKGAYLVKAVSGNSIAYCGFIITGLGVITKAGSSTMSGFAADRTTGKAMNSSFSFYAGTKKLGFSSSSEGTSMISFNPADLPADDPRPLVFAYSGRDMAVSDPYFFFGYSDTRYDTYIFTEQPVYRAGSTVNFKGTIRSRSRSGYVNVPGKEITVKVKDDKGAEIYNELKQTNDNGSFDGTVILDEEARTGDYTIEVQFECGASAGGKFTVEQFKKPEYKVNVTADKSRYYGDEVLNAKVSADYYFGSPVAQADVNYEIHRVRYYRPWWMFSPYADWYRDYYEDNDYDKAGAELIHTGEGKLDADGKFGISFAINEEFKEKNEFDWYRPYYGSSDFKYIVVARVTDNARHSVSGSSEVFVTRGSFLLSAQAGSYLYKPGDAVMIKVNASDFSENPVKTEFTATVYKYGISRFNSDDKQLVTVINGSTEADGKGSVVYESPSAGSEGSYIVEVKALDERAKPVTASAYFYISSGDYNWFGSEGGDVMIVTDKDSYEEGEICKAVIVAPESGIDMYVTSETGDIIFNAVKKFTGTTATVEIPVTDEYLSGFTVSAGYIRNGVNKSASKNLIVIPKKKLLTVMIEPSQLVYKPKEEGRLRVRVVDYSGSPVSDAEVSLGIVDESIYAIMPDKTKSIDKFFYGRQRASVSTAFNSGRTSQGNSRLMTIYEKFGLGEFTVKGTVKGKVADEKGLPVEAAVIMIDELYYAARTNSAGEYSFELPAGNYRIGVLGYKGVKYGRGVSVSRDEESKVDFSVKQDEIIRQPEEQGMQGEMIEMRGGRDETDAVVLEAPRMSVKMKGTDKSAPEPTSGYAEAEVRSDFRDAIFWSPFARTDGQGYADVDVKYPDNLTTWRITCRVITKDTKAGQNVKTVITRKDLLVRLETPRFARENDEITVSAIIHNYLSSDKKVRVSFNSDNTELISGSQSDEVSIPADGEKRLDFVVKAGIPLAEARFYAEALTNEESDAIEVKMPVLPAGLKLQKGVTADFADATKTESKTIDIPPGTDLRSTGLVLNVDPSLASAILTSLDDLVGYPYGCVEQTMSRFLPTVIVANAFENLGAPLSEATKREIPSMVNKGLSRLFSLQHSDGGWGWWQNDINNPFMTAYVVYGLSIAAQTGYQVDKLSMLRGINSIKEQLGDPGTDATTKAYMLYSLSMAVANEKDFISGELDKLDKKGLNNYGRSLVALAYKQIGRMSEAKEMITELKSQAVKLPGEGGAYWEGKKFHYNWQDDKVQTTAMALKALVNIDENSSLKDLVIRWLIMQRQGTSWKSTQETAMIIYSMVDYLKYSSELDPDYTLRVFVNDKMLIDRQITRSDVFSESKSVRISGSELRSGSNEIRIEKNGTGKIYFSADLSYYLPLSEVKPEEEGFRVEKEMYVLKEYREYGGDRISYKPSAFTGTVNTGDVMLFKIKVHTKDEENNYFMLEDPFPSGFEYVKDDWAFKIDNENGYGGYDRYYWRWWYADKDVRDDRIVFFATYFGKGVHEFTYLMRAEIPGKYTINPSKGSLMYYPEVYGNTSGEEITVK